MFNTQAMSSDYRYDVAVAGGCSVDIEQFCAEEKGQLRGTAAVLKCLVKNFQQVGVRVVGATTDNTRGYETGNALSGLWVRGSQQGACMGSAFS